MDRGLRTLARVVAGSLGVAACAPAPPGPDMVPPAAVAPAAPAGAGLFTQAQAERGRHVFETSCSACHGLGEFGGRMFQLTWMTRPIGHFFQHISTAMPQDRPGSLSPEQYASVVAYVLHLNGHPPGSRELPTDLPSLEALAWPK